MNAVSKIARRIFYAAFTLFLILILFILGFFFFYSEPPKTSLSKDDLVPPIEMYLAA